MILERPLQSACTDLIEEAPPGALGYAVIVAAVSQQQWSGPQYAPPRGAPPTGSPSYAPYSLVAGIRQSSTVLATTNIRPQVSVGSLSAAECPSTDRPSRCLRHAEESTRLVLLVVMSLALAALGGLVITGLNAESSTAAYQNDNYRVPPADTNPPPIPIPDTYEQAEQWITQSRFYSQAAPAPVRCNSQPINVMTASDAQLKAHFEGLMECLVRVWEPPVTNAGFSWCGRP